MRSKIAVCLVLAAMFVAAAQARPQSGQGNQQGKDSDLPTVQEQNAAATAANALIVQINAAMDSKQWQPAEDLLKQLIASYPAVWRYQQALGNAQLNLAQYDDAVQTYTNAIKLAQAELDAKSPGADLQSTKLGMAQMFTNEGNVYLKQKKTDLALAAYTKGAEISPNPAVAYFNICAVEYNTGNTTGPALDACDKAIAADPNKADAYFIKGSMLFSNGTMDAQGKYLLPPGTIETLEKYMQLAPTGAHAADVKAMLDAAGVKQ
jgi:tetratricopeptide (TPR) repeat protein